MGLDAAVRCRCWEEGKLKSRPPFEDHVVLDPDTDSLTIDLPWEGNSEKYWALMKWEESCCAHNRMQFVRESISNWPSVRLFQSKLNEFGTENFPTLAAIMPSCNGGLVTPAHSEAALVELDRFCRQDLGTKVVLVDADTGKIVKQYIEAYQGVFFLAPGGWEAGLDPGGFFVRGPRVEYFRSMRFRQLKLGDSEFQLVDEDSGRVFIATFGTSVAATMLDGRKENGRNQVGPSSFSVEERRCEANEFDYIVTPLRSVFRASVETRNPVQWL